MIIKGVGGFYTVRADDSSVYTLRAQNKLRRARVTPYIGDRVVFLPGTEDENGWLTEVLPRRNCLTRPPIANVDLICVVAAAAKPEADLMLTDRMLLLARQAGMDSAVIINKCDLNGAVAADIACQYAAAGFVSLTVSVKTGEGMARLKGLLEGRTHAFAGQSGVGKSSIVNALYGLTVATGGISQKIDRGKHTTRHTELIAVPGGGYVMDTPGFSLLSIDTMPPEALPALYPEFERYAGQCRFTPCLHVSEPDCSVRAALAKGEIDPKRYERYQLHLAETKERWKNRYD